MEIDGFQETVHRKAIIREMMKTILMALILFAAIRTVVHSSEIQGISMEPNMHTEQRIIVNKATYWFGNPQRGDIVVFDTPSKDIIHRIAGLPGEWVEIRNGKLHINGEQTEEPYIQGDSISARLQKVPDEHYFIVGDNRGASRWDIVPRGDIIGKAWVCYWPPSDWGAPPNYSQQSYTPAE